MPDPPDSRETPARSDRANPCPSGKPPPPRDWQVRNSGADLNAQNAGVYIQPGAHRAVVRDCGRVLDLGSEVGLELAGHGVSVVQAR